MVQIHVKAEAEEQQFLYSCSCDSSVAELADAILEIYNLQGWIQALCVHVRQYLLTDAFRENCAGVAIALDRTLSEAGTYASKEQVLHQRFLSPHFLRDHIQTIEKEVKIAHSRGSPESDTQITTFTPELHKDVQLIWAGKELSRGKRLCDYIGGNEKTKITIKLKLGCEDLENRMPKQLNGPLIQEMSKFFIMLLTKIYVYISLSMLVVLKEHDHIEAQKMIYAYS